MKILLDFDGTLHGHKKWQHDLLITQKPITDKRGVHAFTFLRQLLDVKGSHVTIFSARGGHPKFKFAANAWFRFHGLEEKYVKKLHYSNVKGDHDIIYDDRAENFSGIYHHINFFKNFQPWHKKCGKVSNIEAVLALLEGIVEGACERGDLLAMANEGIMLLTGEH